MDYVTDRISGMTLNSTKALLGVSTPPAEKDFLNSGVLGIRRIMECTLVFIREVAGKDGIVDPDIGKNDSGATADSEDGFRYVGSATRVARGLPYPTYEHLDPVYRIAKLLKTTTAIPLSPARASSTCTLYPIWTILESNPIRRQLGTISTLSNNFSIPQNTWLHVHEACIGVKDVLSVSHVGTCHQPVDVFRLCEA